MNRQQLLNEIVKQALKLKIFTYEELEEKLKHIPNCEEKDICIECFLGSPSVKKVFQYYVIN